MKCIFCEREFSKEEIGSTIDKKAITLGNKVVCMNCLRSLSIFLKQIEISAKATKL